MIEIKVKKSDIYLTVIALSGLFLYGFIIYFAFRQLVGICFATGRSQIFTLLSSNGINISYPYFMIWQAAAAGFAAIFLQIFVLAAGRTRAKLVNATVGLSLITAFTLAVSAAVVYDPAKYELPVFLGEIFPYVIALCPLILAGLVFEAKITPVAVVVSVLGTAFVIFEVLSQATIAYRVRSYQLLAVTISGFIVVFASILQKSDGKWTVRRKPPEA